MSGSLFDSLPLWLLFLLTMLLVVLAVEAGSRIGIARARKSDKERNAPIDAMVGSILGLLAFMLAFTFGMANTRNDARKQFVVDEAVAIGSADLRAQLLPDPYRTDIRALLLEYVDVRLAGTRHPQEAAQAIERSEALHELLWSRVADVPPADRGPIAAACCSLQIWIGHKRGWSRSANKPCSMCNGNCAPTILPARVRSCTAAFRNITVWGMFIS